MLPKKTFYGRLCDSGQLTIRAQAGYVTTGGFLDPSTIELKVEIWSSVPFGPNGRAHCTEALIPAPMSDSKYEGAYRDIVLQYQDYWKQHGVEVPTDWKDILARSCGTAMGAFMGSEIARQARVLN